MPQALSAHNSRIARVRDLREKKGRSEHDAFAFEGATLLEEARNSSFPVEELYVTQKAYEETPLVREFESYQVPVYLLDERAFGKISDLEAPTGILAIAPVRYSPLAEIIGKPGITLALADLNDPGNAGTLLRSAEAFGAGGVICGNLGVDPYHPKVVRGAMGSLFRLNVAAAKPEQVAEIAGGSGAAIIGLDSTGKPLTKATGPVVLVVGHERRGLGRWASICTQFASIPMRGPTESLNAAVAGSIALYELTKS